MRSGLHAIDIQQHLRAANDPERADRLDDELRAYPFDVSGMRVLDLAAGPGEFSAALERAQAAAIVWQDIEPAFEQAARAQLNAETASFELRDMMDLSYEAGSFDLVAIRGALYWASDEGALLRKVATLVRHGGWVLIQCPNWRRPARSSLPRVRAVGHLLSPFLALIPGRKRVTTLWNLRWITARRIRNAGLRVVLSQAPAWDQSPPTWFEIVARSQ